MIKVVEDLTKDDYFFKRVKTLKNKSLWKEILIL